MLRLRSSLAAASLNGLFEHPHYMLPAWHLTEHMRRMTMRQVRLGFRSSMSDVACTVRRIGFLAGPAGSVRAYEMRRMIHQLAIEVIYTSCCY